MELFGPFIGSDPLHWIKELDISDFGEIFDRIAFAQMANNLEI